MSKLVVYQKLHSIFEDQKFPKIERACYSGDLSNIAILEGPDDLVAPTQILADEISKEHDIGLETETLSAQVTLWTWRVILEFPCAVDTTDFEETAFRNRLQQVVIGDCLYYIVPDRFSYDHPGDDQRGSRISLNLTLTLEP